MGGCVWYHVYQIKYSNNSKKRCMEVYAMQRQLRLFIEALQKNRHVYWLSNLIDYNKWMNIASIKK